jgi:hypothetical protein
MSVMSGKLETVQILDILQVVNSNRKTGFLAMASPDRSLQGVIHVQRGEVIHAECGDSKGEEAAFDLLALEEGSFVFTPNAVFADRTINRPIQDLVMEAARIADSKRRLFGMFPNPRAVPYLKEKGPNQFKGAKLYEEDKAIAQHIDGFRDFEEITSASGYKKLAVLQTAAVLKDADKMDVVEPLTRVKAVKVRGFLFKSRDIAVSRTLEATWRKMEPYREGLQKVKITNGRDLVTVSMVRFDEKLGPGEIAIPDAKMLEMGIKEGDELFLKPSA